MAYAKCKELDVGIWLIKATFDRAHGILSRYRLGAYLVTYLKIESDVL
jgi:hypothetical protein